MCVYVCVDMCVCVCVLQVRRLLKALQKDSGDADSIHSGDGSNTDSGRGPSEEGENLASRAAAVDYHDPSLGRYAP